MPLTILGDDDVRTLLHSLEKQDILDMQQSLADALHYYSTTAEADDNGCCASFQPRRTVLKRKSGATTLFMPATSNEGMGVKIVTLTEPPPSTQVPDPASMASTPRSSLSSKTPSFSSMSTSDSSRSSESARSSASTYSSSERSQTTSEETSNQRPEDDSNQGPSTSPAGSLTLLDQHGKPRALLNAAEVTAFRTALASTMLFKKRHNVHDIVIFGAGKQAYWHARLALLLRGGEIHHLNVVNRRFERAAALFEALFAASRWPVAAPRPPHTSILTPRHGEYERLLKSTLRAAAAVFCTTPATAPLFPAPILTSPEGRRRGRYLALVGSYAPHMCEVHPDVIRQAVAPAHAGGHYHRHARQGGAVVVDSVDGCLREAGELIQAGLTGSEVVELGELVMLKRDAERRRAERKGEEGFDREGVEVSDERVGKRGGGKKHHHHQPEQQQGVSADDRADQGLREWLERGNVVYKSVGLGLMDVVVGNEIVRLAEQRGFGVRIDNF